MKAKYSTEWEYFEELHQDARKSVGVRRVNKGAISRADAQLYAPFESDKVQELHDTATHARGRRKRVMVKKGVIVEE